MMRSRLLASIVLLVVALADEAEVEPAHVKAALGEDDQCALGAAGCAFEALQTKVVKEVVDAAEDDASAPEMEVIDNSESREEDDDDVPEIDSLEGVSASWYEESNATAAENRAVDGIMLTQEEFDSYALESVPASPEEDPCESYWVSRFKAVGTECFDACPQICGPLKEAVTAFFTKGGAPAVRKTICMRQQSFYCTMLYVNLPKCKTFVERAHGFHIELPTTIPAFQ